ncbi:MAG: hypothetical protein LUF27_01230, partial [Lachnospiraceae bacterium]|nr:hypothetical protein [Lachnospiraceae bacterium]
LPSGSLKRVLNVGYTTFRMIASGYGFTKFFAATMCLLGFCKIVFKLDSYMASLGVSLGRTSGGMGGMGFLMAASRLLSHFGGGSFESGGNSGGTDGGGTPGTGGGSLMPGGGGNGASYPETFSPIPLSAADEEAGNAGGAEPMVFGNSEPEPGTQSSTESGLSGNSENVFSYEAGQEFSNSAFSHEAGQELSSRFASEQSGFESGVSDGGNGINAVSQDDDFGVENMADGIPCLLMTGMVWKLSRQLQMWGI